MGFPHGSDEDAAFIISWLELNNFRGVSLLANSISKLDQKYQGILTIDNLSEAINFRKRSILMKGTGLVDFMFSKITNKKKISVKIENCENGILFLPLLYDPSIYFSKVMSLFEAVSIIFSNFVKNSCFDNPVFISGRI